MGWRQQAWLQKPPPLMMARSIHCAFKALSTDLGLHNHYWEGFQEMIEEMSHGRIKFESYDAGAVVGVTGMLEAADQGVLDVSESWGGFYSGDIPEADVEVGLPLAWGGAWEAYDAYYNRGLLELVTKPMKAVSM